MKLTQEQIAELKRWARKGRARFNLVGRDIPVWAELNEFALARELIRGYAENASRETSCRSVKKAVKSIEKVALYRERSAKAAATRKRQAQARKKEAA